MSEAVIKLLPRLLALPVGDRVELAYMLYDSIPTELDLDFNDVLQRPLELDQGKDVPHVVVMTGVVK